MSGYRIFKSALLKRPSYLALSGAYVGSVVLLTHYHLIGQIALMKLSTTHLRGGFMTGVTAHSLSPSILEDVKVFGFRAGLFRGQAVYNGRGEWWSFLLCTRFPLITW